MNKQKTDMMQKYAQDLDSTRVVKTFAQLFAEIYFAKTMSVVGLASGQSFPLDLPLEPAW